MTNRNGPPRSTEVLIIPRVDGRTIIAGHAIETVTSENTLIGELGELELVYDARAQIWREQWRASRTN